MPGTSPTSAAASPQAWIGRALGLALLAAVMVGCGPSESQPDDGHPTVARPAAAREPARDVHAFLAHLDEASVVTPTGLEPLSRHRPESNQPWTEDERLWISPPIGRTIRFSDVPLGKASVLRLAYGRLPGAAAAPESGTEMHFEAWVRRDGARVRVLDETLAASEMAPGELRETLLELSDEGQDRAHFEFRVRCSGDIKGARPAWRGLRLERDPPLRPATMTVTVPRGPVTEALGVASVGDPERSWWTDGADESRAAAEGEYVTGSLLHQRVPATAAFDIPCDGDGVISFCLGTLADKRYGPRRLRATLRVDGEQRFTQLLGDRGSPITALQSVPFPAAGRDAVRVEFSVHWDGDTSEGLEPRDDVQVLWLEPKIADVATRPRQRATDGPNVLVVVVDTLRADHISAMDHVRPTTPSFDALARDGVLFTRAMASSSWTVPSMATLLTGRSAYAHGLFDAVHWRLDPGVPSMAEVFHAGGWSTVCVMSNPLLSHRNAATRGFEHFAHMPYAHAGQVNRGFLDWFDGHADERVFALLHYFDPHDPYSAPGDALHRFAPPKQAAQLDRSSSQALMSRLRPGLSELEPGTDPRKQLDEVDRQRLLRLEQLYDGEIAYWDQRFGELLEELDARGALDDTIVIVTSDHGEEFVDHGMLGHGRSLHRELLHVPLLVWNSEHPAGSRDDLVGLIDLAPTLLELTGVQVAPWLDLAFEGRSLFGPVDPHRQLYAQTSHGELVFDGEPVELQAVFSREGKAVRVRGEDALTLYDLRSDVAELRPLAQPGESLPRDLNTLLDLWEQSASAHARAAQGPLDPEALEALRAMGYVR